MAIMIQFSGVVIPMDRINRCKAIGGLAGILEMQKNMLGKTVFHDDNLYCETTMGPNDNELIVKFWEEQGLEFIKVVDGEEKYSDLCVVDCGGSSLSCDWLGYEMSQSDKGLFYYVYLKGKPKGKLVSRYGSYNGIEL